MNLIRAWFSCMKGGLVRARHNDVRDEFANVCSQALGGGGLAVGTKSLIFYGAVAVACPKGTKTVYRSKITSNKSRDER